MIMQLRPFALSVANLLMIGFGTACVKLAVAQPGLTDVIVRQDVLAQHWIVRDEDLPGTLCSVEEGGITPGMHTVLRFSVSTPNIGTADLLLGDPHVHISNRDGVYELAICAFGSPLTRAPVPMFEGRQIRR